MTPRETVLAFVDGINAHDLTALRDLMTDNHTFIDAHGNQISGREQMLGGWRGYFEWFPDYWIDVIDIFENENGFGMFGFAGGSFKGQSDQSWRLPAAWKAAVKDGGVALWQVVADTKIPFEIITRNS